MSLQGLTSGDVSVPDAATSGLRGLAGVHCPSVSPSLTLPPGVSVALRQPCPPLVHRGQSACPVSQLSTGIACPLFRKKASSHGSRLEFILKNCVVLRVSIQVFPKDYSPRKKGNKMAKSHRFLVSIIPRLSLPLETPIFSSKLG